MIVQFIFDYFLVFHPEYKYFNNEWSTVKKCAAIDKDLMSDKLIDINVVDFIKRHECW
jgi:hypothetical protein